MESGARAASVNETPRTPSLAEATHAVCSLADLMATHGLTRLDLTVGDVAIRLRAAGGEEPPRGHVTEEDSEPAPESEVPVAEGHLVTAPMIGTYYAAAAPGEPPYVRPGDRIEVGQVIGIIEAMKIMNEIAADRAGVVHEILVQNAQAVEYGSPLIRLGSE